MSIIGPSVFQTYGQLYGPNSGSMALTQNVYSIPTGSTGSLSNRTTLAGPTSKITFNGPKPEVVELAADFAFTSSALNHTYNFIFAQNGVGNTGAAMACFNAGTGATGAGYIHHTSLVSANLGDVFNFAVTDTTSTSTIYPLQTEFTLKGTTMY